ncbi:unnamed protein product [Fusarium graminearum]|nr:unnamed protein product [Fusarium graminearum]
MPWKRWIIVLYLCCGLVLVRSVYRVIEYATGPLGVVQGTEIYFYVFDSGSIFMITCLFNIFHPRQLATVSKDDLPDPETIIVTPSKPLSRYPSQAPPRYMQPPPFLPSHANLRNRGPYFHYPKSQYRTAKAAKKAKEAGCVYRVVAGCDCGYLAGFETPPNESYNPVIPYRTEHNLSSAMQSTYSDVLGGPSASTTSLQHDTDPIRLHNARSSSIITQAQLQEGVTTSQPYETFDTISPLIRPRYLCYVTDFENRRFETVKVSDYIKEHENENVDLEFVFVSYTRVQFRVATDEEIENYIYASEAERNANKQLAHRDRQQLIDWGIDAARRAGKKSFWLDFECIRSHDGIARATSSSDDVYHICDIVRAAHSMIIAIGPSTEDKIASILDSKDLKAFSPNKVTPWLQQWGSRLWTLPELLLCPNEHRIQLYIASDTSEPMRMAKRNFAERAWEDAIVVQELVHHFEGSATLTMTQLMEAAFECFSRRQTDQFSQGDITYAIMGLFSRRHRPTVDKGDSGLQAFAKLAFKNDCGAFLSRVICFDPPPSGPWYSSVDLRGRQLITEVHPQVTDVLGPDVLLLDNVYGAMIDWDNLDPESDITRLRLGDISNGINFVFVESFVVLCLLLCFLAYVLQIVPTGYHLFLSTAGLILWICACVAIIRAFILLKRSISTAEIAPSGRLIGIEGRVGVNMIEEYLWGFNHGRLKIMEPQHDSCISRPERVTPDDAGAYDFTIVDTRLMTVTYIVSDEPPTAVLVLRKRDGLYGQFLCSYDSEQPAFHRQSVFRTDLKGVEDFHKHKGIRLSLDLLTAQTSRPTLQNIRPENRQATNRFNDATENSIAADVPKKWRVLIFMYFFLINLRLIALPIVVLLQPIVADLFWPIYGGKYYEFICEVVKGFISGLEIPCMVAIVWTWFTLEELPLVLLALTLTGEKFLVLASGSPIHQWYPYLMVIIGIVLCKIPSTVHTCLIGSPDEVSWLSAKDKISYKEMSANKASQIARQTVQRRLIRYLLVFVLSAITKFDVHRNYVAGYTDGFGVLVLMMIIGTILLKFQQASCKYYMVIYNLALVNYN